MRALEAIAARGRYVLVAGLILGLAFPAWADTVRPLVGPMVVGLLFLATLRIGPAILALTRRDLAQSLLAVAALQLALPLLALALFWALGWLSAPYALATLLVLSAAPITGSAHIAVMTGGNPTPALRQSVIGTAVLPLTVLPVFALVPAFGGGAEVIGAVLRLLLIIAVAGGAALALRHFNIVADSAKTTTVIDATSAILLGAVVIGLMAAAAEALRHAPGAFLLAMASVSALAFTLQAISLKAHPDKAEAIPLAVVAGCRNVALFLSVLPAATIDPLLLLIGCYQVPMYLTPMVLPRLKRWLT